LGSRSQTTAGPGFETRWDGSHLQGWSGDPARCFRRRQASSKRNFFRKWPGIGDVVPATGLMTVEEFRQLPETGPFYYELRHGEPVQVTRPKKKHAVIQRKLCRSLERRAGQAYWVQEELAFRPLPEHELWMADIAAVTAARWDATDDDDNLAGSPELVIEVLSAA